MEYGSTNKVYLVIGRDKGECATIWAIFDTDSTAQEFIETKLSKLMKLGARFRVEPWTVSSKILLPQEHSHEKL